MRLAIMQPYFFPYIGYWQLIKSVDVFVIYDNIEYTKKGWINRNRYLSNGKAAYFTIPLKKQSDYLCINERTISETYNPQKLINQLSASYHKAPYFKDIMPFVKDIFEFGDSNLFDFIYHSIIQLKDKLKINTEIVVSSTLNFNNTLKSKYKVLAICKELGADEYINPIGGMELYSRDEFNDYQIMLKFLESNPAVYNQLGYEFVSNLSIIDVLMFNSAAETNEMLDMFQLIVRETYIYCCIIVINYNNIALNLSIVDII